MTGREQPAAIEDAIKTAGAKTQNGGIIHVVREYVRHEVFLNSLFGGKALATEEHYVRKYRNLMRRLP